MLALPPHRTTDSSSLRLPRTCLQKAEQEASRKHMEVPERNYEKEHEAKTAEVRAKEAAELAAAAAAAAKPKMRQCNEGRYDFQLIDEDGRGNIVVEVAIPKFFSTALVDVDAQVGRAAPRACVSAPQPA